MYQICIHPNEVAELLNVSENTARRYLRGIKVVYVKENRQKVSIKEFCVYMDLPFKDVFCMINNIKSDDYEAAILKSGIEVPKIEFLSHKK